MATAPWGPGFAYFTPWGWGPGYYGSYGYGYGYGGYGGYGGGYGQYAYDIGSVKLKVKPRDAEVYVDNYFAGYVDDFDGMFQALKWKPAAIASKSASPASRRCSSTCTSSRNAA